MSELAETALLVAHGDTVDMTTSGPENSALDMANVQDFPSIERVSVPTLVEATVEQLRKLILSGQLRPGEHLVEERLTARLGVSRAPVREALRILQRDGIVQKVERHGFKVVAITADGVREIYSLRMALERLAIELGVPVSEPSRIEPMKDAMHAMRAAATSGDQDGLLTSNSAFHRGLVGLAAHSRLEQVYDAMQMQMRLCMAYNLRFRQRLYPDPQDAVIRHDALLNNVIAGKKALVLKDLQNHGAGSFLHHLEELLAPFSLNAKQQRE